MADSLRELQQKVKTFADERDWARYHSPRNLAMGVVVEAGELLELYLWSEDGELPVASRRPRLEEEMADVLISLLNLAERSGVDLGAAVEAKLARNAEKYPVERARGRLEKYHELPEAPVKRDGEGPTG